MSEKLKIFLGADGNGSDNYELGRLGNEAFREGYKGYRNFTVAINMLRQELGLEENEIIIRGGSIEACIAIIIKKLEKMGVKKIEVDLANCRIDGGDKGTGRETILKRQKLLEKRLKELN